MNNSMGIKLIEELNLNPKKFNEEGKAYQLLQEYFNGLSKETLRHLLCDENPLILRVAIWIASEIGIDAHSLLKDIIPLVDYQDRYIKYHVLEIIAVCSVGENINEFTHLTNHLEYTDEVIRILAMRLIANTDLSQLKEYVMHQGSSHKKYTEGLSKLLDIDKISTEEVFNMINNSEPLIRKYGIIIAKKLYKKIPNLIKDSISNKDSDVSKFAQEVLEIYSS